MLINRKCMFLMALLVIFMLTGCGQKVVDTVPPIKTTMGRDDAKAVIVILPLADYSAGDTIDSPLRRQVKVRESIAYRLVQFGYYPPVQEDVSQYLTTHNIDITVSGTDVNDGARQVLESEMASGGWSGKIQSEVNNIVAKNDQGNAYINGRYDRLGLSHSILKGIGDHFKADYVLRGRIIEYRMVDPNSAIFELALMLQDIGTGDIVWANRVSEEVKDRSYLWNDPQERKQIDVAIDHAVERLISDLAATLEKLPARTVDYSDEVEQNPLPKNTTTTQPILEEPLEKGNVREEHPANWGS